MSVCECVCVCVSVCVCMCPGCKVMERVGCRMEVGSCPPDKVEWWSDETG